MVTSRSRALPEGLTSPDPILGLAAVLALRDLADEVEAAHVVSARRQGWSWADIGQALGVSRQSVHKKYARTVG
jgi:hypothetical protein